MGTQSINFDSISDSCNTITSLAGKFESTIDASSAATDKVCYPAWEGEASENFHSELKNLVDKLPKAKEQLAYSVLYLTAVSDGYDTLGKTTLNKLIDLVGGQSYIDNLDVSKMPDPDLTLKNASPDDAKKAYEDDKTKKSSSKDKSGTSDGTTYGNNYYGQSTTETTTGMAGQTIFIPSSVDQGEYTVTGYDYWINTGKEMTWKDGTDQNKVAEIWKKQGSRFKNGIAVINVNGHDRYLVALSTKFGAVGDCVDVKLSDGTTVPALIADSKGSNAGSEWGHKLSSGKINVLEFEVERKTFLEKGNPTTEKWGLEWDSDKPVSSMFNKGSVLDTNATVTKETVSVQLKSGMISTTGTTA